MNKDFDDIFKSKLEDHSSTFPSDMWDNIDAAINPPKRNKRVLWFSLICIGLISIIGGFLFSSDVDSLNNDAVVSLENTISQVRTSSNHSAVSISKEINQSAFTDQIVDDITVNANSSFKEIEFRNDVSTEKAKELSSIENHSTFNSIAKYTNKNITSNFINTESGNKNLNKEKAINKRKITFTEALLDNNSRNIKESENSFKSNPQINTRKILQSNVNSRNKSLFGNNNTSDRTLRFQDISKLPSLFDLANYTSSPHLKLKMTSPPGLDCPTWVREKLGLYLEAYYAPEYGLRSITAKDRDSIIMAHQNSRNETEKALISYSLGARALFLTPSGISFKIGINYSQINERFTWQDPESLREITIVDTDPVSGDTISSYVTYEYATEVEERINRYKSIDLSLLIGYEKHYRKKLSFSMNAGIYLNLVAKQRGMFLDPTGNRSWFSSDDGTYDVYKRSVGVSFFASGGLMYHWVDGIDFFAEPSIRFYSKSMTLKDYPLNQNYVVMGIHTGIRYKF